MRLIDADAVEEYLYEYIDPYEVPGALQAISKMPTIEPKRKKGKWDTFFSDSYKVHEIGVECSCCGYRTHERTNYCPNCGAEMRGDAE